MERATENINIEGILGDNKIIVKTSDIIKKLRTRQDCHNFALENNWYIPDLKDYDATFLFLVMKGEKKCLPIGFRTGFPLNSFRKDETLNKQYIINKIMNNPKFKDYIPNGVNPMYLTRDFLLTLSIHYLNIF